MDRLSKGFHIKTINCLFLFILQGTRQSKIEKADILEMTVRHLRTVHENKSMGMCIFFQLSFINF